LTLKINGVRAIVKVHVPAQFHQAQCSGSWVILRTPYREKNHDENNTVHRYHADSKNCNNILRFNV